MAVTTGTTWDIVLANEPVSVPDADTVSARAAYQAALYGRAVIVDVRSRRRRRADGALPAEVESAVVGRHDLALWLRESFAARVLLLDDDGSLTGRPVAADPRAAAVVGGFAGWQAAGLPTA